MHVRLHSALFLSTLLSLSAASVARAQTCEARPALPLERQMRQVYLDLLGRPPTYDEYVAVKAKGSFDQEAIRKLLGQEEFYERMRQYHRELLLPNVSSSIT